MTGQRRSSLRDYDVVSGWRTLAVTPVRGGKVVWECANVRHPDDTTGRVYRDGRHRVRFVTKLRFGIRRWTFTGDSARFRAKETYERLCGVSVDRDLSSV